MSKKKKKKSEDDVLGPVIAAAQKIVNKNDDIRSITLVTDWEAAVTPADSPLGVVVDNEGGTRASSLLRAHHRLLAMATAIVRGVLTAHTQGGRQRNADSQEGAD